MTTNKTLTQWQAENRKLELSDVKQVYSGRVGKCCCGCSGNHRYPSSVNPVEVRGYSVGGDEGVSDRSVKLVFNKLQANADLAEMVDDNDFVSLDLGNRTYVLYLK